VVRYHGACPPRRPNQIYVANHTTVLDIVVILNDRVVSLVGQRHQGVLGFFQTYVLDCMSNLWFDRMDNSDRSAMSRKIKEHIQDASKPPLLLFPEGTCVNNEYCVMFKRGAFEMDATIIPVAIKYNRLFGDAFWNSKLHSFPVYLARLMTSWCVVADITYLEPQTRREGETSIEFAGRVKAMICEAAGLQAVPWDGYLKYFKPSEREKRARQKIFAQILQHRFSLTKQ
jgi:glycerol-3-phosphate O-acyltransferase 3/4